MSIPDRPSVESPFDTEFDFSFRPETYWLETQTEETVLARIKGTERRAIARRALEGDALDPELAEFTLQPELSVEVRGQWGAIHPSLMGGEYLPTLEVDEVEIARIDLESVTGDAIQLVARPDRGRIRLRMVDEYECSLVVPDARSDLPLSMGELIDLIDGTEVGDYCGDADSPNGLTDFFRDSNIYGVPTLEMVERLRYFVSVSSAFYPQLDGYYERRADQWLLDRRAALGHIPHDATAYDGGIHELAQHGPHGANGEGVINRLLYGLGCCVGLVEGVAARLSRWVWRMPRQ